MTSDSLTLMGGSIELAELAEVRTEKVLPKEFPYLPFVGLDDIEAHTMTLLGVKDSMELKSSAKRFYKGDVLYSRLRPYLNKVWRADRDGICSSEFIVIPQNKDLDGKFLSYRLNAADFVAYANSLNAGDRPRVDFTQISSFLFPAFSIIQQRKVVAKIEELFSELDNGIAALKTAREQLKVYRQAVLKRAFEGKLTAKWREENADKLETPDQLLARIQQEREARYQQQLDEWKAAVKAWEANGKEGKKPGKPKEQSYRLELDESLKLQLQLPDSWTPLCIGNVFSVYVGATPSRKERSYWNGNIRWVSSGEVAFRNISDTSEKITQSGFENTSTDLHPIGTVLLAMIGEGKTRGQAAILRVPAAHNQNTAAVRVSEVGLPPEFLYYFLMYQYEQTRRMGSGNNQKALNKSRVASIQFPLCSELEQMEIADQLAQKLSVLDSFNREIDDALDRVETLRQSILKKAFSGQLVPQDPNDEPASELLARIKAEKEKTAASTKKKPTAKRGRKAKVV